MISHAAVAIALNAQAADEGGQWVHLIPAGRFNGRDGRGPWEVKNASALISETIRRQGSALPVDYEHQTDEAPKNGQPAPAAGWIKALQSRADGVWGRIEWTARAAAHLAAREYRFISPVFVYRPGDGEVAALLRASLTNNPNLELVALARAAPETPMDDLSQLQQLLGLTSAATLPQIVSSVRGLVEQKALNTPDPAKFVAMQTFELVSRELMERNQGLSAELAEVAVNKAISDGRLFSGLKEWGIALARADRNAFDQYCSRVFANMQTLDKPIVVGKYPGQESGRLSDTDALIAKTLGHSEQDFIAANRNTIK